MDGEGMRRGIGGRGCSNMGEEAMKLLVMARWAESWRWTVAEAAKGCLATSQRASMIISI